MQPETGRLAFHALLAFTFILLLAPQVWFPALAPLRIAFMAAVLSMVACLGSRISQGLPLVAWTPALVLVALLVAWSLCMVPLSRWPGGSVEYLLDQYFKTLLVFFLLVHVVNSVTRLRQLCQALVLMSLPLALTTLKNYASGTLIEGGERVAGYSAALTQNPNDLALMLNLLLPLGVGLFLAERRALVRLGLGVILLLLVLAILATFSRAGFLTLATISLCYLWLLRGRAERLWLHAALVLALLSIPLLPDSYIDRIVTIVEIEQDASNSAQTRAGDIRAAVGVVLDNPLVGAGPGMNAVAMNEARGTTWTEVHNVYLQLAVELGLPGLLLFLLLYHRCFGAVRAVVQRTRGLEARRELFCLAEGIQVSLLAFAIAAMFHPVAYHFYFYYMAGLALAAKAICDTQE